jgi:hypothetical protein
MEYNEIVHQLVKDIKKTYNSAKREILYNILRVRGAHKTSRAD